MTDEVTPEDPPLEPESILDPVDAKEEKEKVKPAVDTESAADTDPAVDTEPEVEPLVVDPPDDGVVRRWFAIHAHSGQEANVKKHLLIQADQENLLDNIANILIPMEEVAEYKSGEKKISKRKFFPGYVLIQLPDHPEKNPDLWHLIKETPGVSGFIGTRTTPTPLDEGEVNAIIEEIRGERERPRPKVEFETSERVKIIDGPFTNFMGNIDEINEERAKMKVMVEIFERLTSVEVDFWQVEKL